MARLWFPALLAGFLLTFPCSSLSLAEAPRLPLVDSQEIPDDWEKQVDEQTEKLPDEIREKMRERIKESIRKRLSEMEASEDAEETPSEEESSSDEASDEDSESDEGDEEEAEEKKPEAPAKDPLSEESKKLKAEMDLESTRFKHQIAMYEKEIEAQRLQNAKDKIDRKLEADRHSGQLLNMQRERDRLKLELDLLKQQAALESERATAKLAESRATKAALELSMEVESTKESLEDRILGEESYPDEPFKDGVLKISLRRIELNGPIMQGAADYVCQRIDYFNNQSAKPIFLVIDNCPGGSAIEGMQIVQAIEHSKAPVHVVVKRYAASMAAIIATLADHSYCYPDAIILHHQASTSMYGNGRDIKDQVRQLKDISTRLIGAVADKQGLTEEEFVDQMYENRTSGDWELFGDQAVERKWVNNVATTIHEQGIRRRPKGMRRSPSIFSIGGEQQTQAPEGYLERYEVMLPEQVDSKGRRYVRLPRLSPVDAWLIYNPDDYYRQ